MNVERQVVKTLRWCCETTTEIVIEVLNCCCYSQNRTFHCHLVALQRYFRRQKPLDGNLDESEATEVGRTAAYCASVRVQLLR